MLKILKSHRLYDNREAVEQRPFQKTGERKIHKSNAGVMIDMKKICCFLLFFCFITVVKVFCQEMPEIEMVFVKGGSYTMGCDNLGLAPAATNNNEEPSHRVTLDAYYIGKYEVTQEQYAAVMGKNPSRYKGDNLPVEQVSWENIQEFISKLKELTGKNYRLPTEAEWEYAARGGHDGIACSYGCIRPAGYVPHRYEVQNTKCAMSEEQCRCSKTETCPVGSYWPNELDIYDMCGNVLEWCSDWYAKYTDEAVVNPKGPESGVQRVIRGYMGPVSAYAIFSRKIRKYPDHRDGSIGFRLALSFDTNIK